MKCPTYPEWLDYVVNDFQTEQEKAMMKEHVDGCSDCRKGVLAIEQALAAMIYSAEQECDLVREHLLEYIDGKITTVAEIDLTEHLAGCEACSFIHRQLTKKLSLEDAKTLNYLVPERLTRKIEYLLAEAKKAAQPSGIGESLKEGIRQFVDRIVLILAPAPEPAFLGSAIAGEMQVKISGKELEVDVGKVGKVVKIFSLDNDELDRQVSDQDGIVVFEDFEPGVYKIMVEGFEIKKVKVMK